MQNSNNYLIPFSIVIAGALVAFGLHSGLSSQHSTGYAQHAEQPQVAQPHAAPEPPPGPQAVLKTELDGDEFIYGNPDAPVFIVEYSDIDCPFCARVHPTLESVVDNSDGQIAWAFRHFPLEQLHPDAWRKAMAAECVGKLAGNDSFWQYIDGLFKKTSTDTYAEYGISASDFTTCMEDPATHEAVQADMDRAIATGGTGTPHSVVSTDSVGIALSGAQPEAVWSQAAEALLNF